MKEVHDVKMIKNIGQFVVTPILGILLTILALKAGRIPGGWAFIFGGFIFIAMASVVLVLFDKFVVKKIQASNEAIEKAEKERLRKMIEEENDPDAYPEYDDSTYLDE